MNKYKVRKVYPGSVRQTLTSIGFERNYIDKILDKYSFNLIKICSLRSPAANILKQVALSKGGDLGVSAGTVNCSLEHTDGLLVATDKQLKMIIESLKLQPYGLKDLANELQLYLSNKYAPLKPLAVKEKTFYWGAKTHIMGILNVTPDSFSDGGKHCNIDAALNSVKEMVENGVDIIDIGPESTRPFAGPVDSEMQIDRAIPIIKEIRNQFPDVTLSIDTRDHKVAFESINSGADIINDVSGLTYDSKMVKVASDTGAPLIIMHSQGTPENMQIKPSYKNLMDELCNFLIDKAEFAIENGVNPNKIILDPGIGFGKTTDHNLEIIQRVSEVKSLGYPVLVGVSRKAFIGKILDSEIDSREDGTAAANVYLASQGVDIIRVHDVERHSKIIQIADSISRSKF